MIDFEEFPLQNLSLHSKLMLHAREGSLDVKSEPLVDGMSLVGYSKNYYHNGQRLLVKRNVMGQSPFKNHDGTRSNFTSPHDVAYCSVTGVSLVTAHSL